MRRPLFRMTMFALVIIGIAFLFNLYFVHFSGDGKKTPEEALPTDHDYVWIAGPKTEKVHRYFFLSNGNYFGTGTVTKNFRGWSQGSGVYGSLPTVLHENELTSAHSDEKIIYGLVKKQGDVVVKVNDVEAVMIDLTELPEEQSKQYNVEGYFIWYVDLEELEDTETFTIQLFNEQNEKISELEI